MTNNIDNIFNEMLSICLIDKFLWGFGLFSFFTFCALFILLVVDAFECSRLNEDEDFNTTSGFEYLYGLAADALKGTKQWFLALGKNNQEPGSPVSVNAFPEMPTPSPVPGNLRTKSCVTEAHQKALDDEDAKASASMDPSARVAAAKVEMPTNFAKKNPGPGTHHDWINVPFHSIGEQMASETEAYNAQNKTKTH